MAVVKQTSPALNPGALTTRLSKPAPSARTSVAFCIGGCMIRENLHNTRMISTAIIGTAGYTGQETLDRVLSHPELELVALGSNTFAGRPSSVLDPRLATSAIAA